MSINRDEYSRKRETIFKTLDALRNYVNEVTYERGENDAVEDGQPRLGVPACDPNLRGDRRAATSEEGFRPPFGSATVARTAMSGRTRRRTAPCPSTAPDSQSVLKAWSSARRTSFPPPNRARSRGRCRRVPAIFARSSALRCRRPRSRLTSMSGRSSGRKPCLVHWC